MTLDVFQPQAHQSKATAPPANGPDGMATWLIPEQDEIINYLIPFQSQPQLP